MRRTFFLNAIISISILIFLLSCKKNKGGPSDTVTVTTFAGSGENGFADGNGTAAKFYVPEGIAVDAQGNIYISDAGNNRVRKITSTATVSTLAGNGMFGNVDGNSDVAQFKSPSSVAIDKQGNIYVLEEFSNRIRKITSAGQVATYSSNTPGYLNGDISSAQFRELRGIAIDGLDNIYVSDYGNQCIRKITPAGVVSTLAGNGTAGFADGNGNAAQFNNPQGITTDQQANVYVADYANQRVRKITPAGMVSTLAGIGTTTTGPMNVAADAQGNIYVTESSLYGYQRIHKITASGTATILAGSVVGYADGPGSTALFKGLHGIALDAQGNIYVSDRIDNRIRKISKI